VTGFFERLRARVTAADSVLCVGIDPRGANAMAVRAEALALIAATADAAAAFKPNAAFFEALGRPGLEVLMEIVAAVPEEIPVILDAKRGDIASSATGYATAAFDVIGAGAVTVNPYLGRDAIDPFLAHDGRAVWVLCHTSNPSAAELQEAKLASGWSLAEEVARRAAGWAGPDRLGLVVGATRPGALGAIRRAAPEHWILAPGVGAQGGAIADLAAGLRADGGGLLVPVSRAIAGATDPRGAAADLRDALRALRPRPGTPRSLAVDLYDSGCVRTGEFTLKSGAVSPIYVDLRRLTGTPAALRRVAAGLAGLAADFEHDHLAAVPYGAIPLATAVALAADSSLVWPRPQPKAHGDQRAVEGVWQPGDRVVLIDDVATSGSSALEAARLLRAAGLVVEHLVVVVERNPAARVALGEAGLALHAMTTLGDLVADLGSIGRIDAATRGDIERFLAR
jgi:uridine monophosphate synthetase